MYDLDYEALRLKELNMHGIMDTAQEQDFNEIIDIAAEVTDCPVALITLLDNKRQWFKANKGMAVNETPIEHSFCQYTILQDDIFIVEDATKDSRFINNVLVTGGPKIKFYAGVPIKSKNGFNLGSLCVIDTKSRTLTQKEKNILQKLARQVTQLLDLRIKNNLVEKHAQEQLSKKEQWQNVNVVHDFISDVVKTKLNKMLDDVNYKINYIQAKELSKEKIDKLLNSVYNKLTTSVELMNRYSEIKHSQLHQFSSDNIHYSISDVIQAVTTQYQHEMVENNNETQIHLPQNFSIQNNSAHIEFILKSLLQLLNGIIKNAVFKINCISDDTALLFVIKTASNNEVINIKQKEALLQSANIQFTQEIINQGGGIIEYDIQPQEATILFSLRHNISKAEETVEVNFPQALVLEAAY